MGSARQQPAVKVDVSQDKSEARLMTCPDTQKAPRNGAGVFSRIRHSVSWWPMCQGSRGAKVYMVLN